MKTIKIFIAGLLIIGFSACNKDFLDVKPSNSIDSDISIQTAADAKAIISGMMSKMRSSSYYGRNFFMYGDAKGGDLTIYSRGRGLDGLYTFSHSAETGSYSGFWDQIYDCILQTNSVLESIDSLQAAGSTENFDIYEGQALTARAMFYFDLVRLYGKPYTQDKSAFGVPNITKPLPHTAQPLRATVEENYNQIMNDLVAAEPLISKSKSNGFLNYYANMALQARVNLNMGKNDEALTAAQKVMGSSLYSLYSNDDWVDSWKSQFGSESIFELAVLPSEGDLGTASLGYYLRRKGHGGGAAAGWFMASDYFLDRLYQDSSDVRWGVMARDEISSSRKGALYKYSGGTQLEGDGKTNSSAVNIKVIRLSEIYLIAAEAALTSDPDLAAGYLNKIRARSPKLAPATAGTITLDMILDEKSKELFGEGQRFFDLMRLNKTITFNDDLGGVAVPTRDKTIDRTFYKTVLPISQDEINANPGIKAQQNPDY